LLVDGASNREIARQPVISVNTVKKHVSNVCGKLGCTAAPKPSPMPERSNCSEML
jgi:DNA-binding NarL/FixJ family response regulator